MKKILFFSFLGFICMAPGAYAQQIDAALKENFQDAEYFFSQESYPDALVEYLKLNKKFPENASYNYKIGICYLNMPGQKEKAVPYLQKAAQNVSAAYKDGIVTEKRAPLDAFLFLGNAFRINNQLDNAIIAYKRYKDLVGKTDQQDIDYANQQIAACKTAQEYMNNPAKVKETNLGRTINNSAANIRPVLSGDGKTMAYVTKLKFYDAIYVSRMGKNGWQLPVEITSQIISDGNQYPAGLSYDGDTLFLNKEDNFNSDIYMSTFARGVWSPSKPLGRTINTRYWESYGSITDDGKEFYFASNRKGGVGNMDIYVSHKQPNGEWGEPKCLGKNINTELNEDCPVISPDGKILFFSSQGHQTMGGFDIFYAKRLSSDEWSEPVNLGYPINTTDDDLYFAPEQNGHYFYLARSEKGGLGESDIYRFELLPDARNKLALLYEIKEVKIPGDSLLNVAPDSLAVAKIITPVTVKKEPAGMETKTEKTIVQSPVEKDTAKKITATKLASTLITTGKDTLTAKKEVKPKSAFEKTRMEIMGVLFAFNSYNLTAGARAQLDKVVIALKTFDQVMVEIDGYADSRGTGHANMAISKLRAESVARYLASKGISEKRMKIEGFGSDHPIARNTNADGSDNPAGRRLNRRVEFRIVANPEKLLIIKEMPVPDSLKVK